MRSLGIEGTDLLVSYAAEVVSIDPTAWYRKVYRWGQTNLTEVDPIRYDASRWREHWRWTRVQGVIVNAGVIVAYYPSKYPLHHRALELGDRDLYGEIVLLRARKGWRFLPGWTPTEATRHTSPASTAPITTSSCLTYYARSSGAAIRTGSPTTVGVDSIVRESAIVSAAPASFVTPLGYPCLVRAIGTIRPTASESSGTTDGASRQDKRQRLI